MQNQTISVAKLKEKERDYDRKRIADKPGSCVKQSQCMTTLLYWGIKWHGNTTNIKERLACWHPELAENTAGSLTTSSNQKTILNTFTRLSMHLIITLLRPSALYCSIFILYCKRFKFVFGRRERRVPRHVTHFGATLRCHLSTTFRRRSYLFLIILTSYVINIFTYFGTYVIIYCCLMFDRKELTWVFMYLLLLCIWPRTGHLLCVWHVCASLPVSK